MPTFDGRLDPQLFPDWLRSVNKHFTCYPLSEPRKIKFVEIKLTGQASQYWTNVENMRVARLQRLTDTWELMNDELKDKVCTTIFLYSSLGQVTLIHQRQQICKEYVAKFNEFFIRCTSLNTEGEAQILSRFRVGLRKGLRTELLAR